MVRRWRTGPIAKSPEPRLRQDVPFAIVPGTGRVLLHDVWQPPGAVPERYAEAFALTHADARCPRVTMGPRFRDLRPVAGSAASGIPDALRH